MQTHLFNAHFWLVCFSLSPNYRRHLVNSAWFFLSSTGTHANTPCNVHFWLVCFCLSRNFRRYLVNRVWHMGLFRSPIYSPNTQLTIKTEVKKPRLVKKTKENALKPNCSHVDCHTPTSHIDTWRRENQKKINALFCHHLSSQNHNKHVEYPCTKKENVQV
jgi:hypothetical protein